ncbi:MAG: ATP-binding cassette domain-containing protein [Peptococcaceae bacterium]|nr:ATP-binding cassette domain-containing protein [Peptococcaceae bacterium]
MAEAIITAEGLGYQLGSRYLLKDINWNIEKNSRWLVIGMNGSGKTTLLSILAGYRMYNHGNLKYRNISYDAQDVFEIRKKMGWVSNSFYDQVYHNESVLDMLLSGLSGTYGAREKLAEDGRYVAKIKLLLKYMGLSDCLDVPFSWLSKGERQAVLIIRALLGEPEVMVFDEPMTGLDVLAREQIRRLIELLVERRQHTMIYVTHHFDEVSAKLFDKCILLKQGVVYQQGNIEDIFRSEVISNFLNVPTQVSQDMRGYYSLSFM